MKNILFIFILLFIVNCSLNKVVKHHGVPFLDKKEKKLVLSSSNTNDITQLLGPPSTKSTLSSPLSALIFLIKVAVLSNPPNLPYSLANGT